MLQPDTLLSPEELSRFLDAMDLSHASKLSPFEEPRIPTDFLREQTTPSPPSDYYEIKNERKTSSDPVSGDFISKKMRAKAFLIKNIGTWIFLSMLLSFFLGSIFGFSMKKHPTFPQEQLTYLMTELPRLIQELQQLAAKLKQDPPLTSGTMQTLYSSPSPIFEAENDASSQSLIFPKEEVPPPTENLFLPSTPLFKENFPHSAPA